MLIASRLENANIFIVFCSSSTPYATITHFWLQIPFSATSSMAVGILLKKRCAGVAIATSGKMTTITPLSSVRVSSMAPQRAAPQEMPTLMPSFR